MSNLHIELLKIYTRLMALETTLKEDLETTLKEEEEPKLSTIRMRQRGDEYDFGIYLDMISDFLSRIGDNIDHSEVKTSIQKLHGSMTTTFNFLKMKPIIDDNVWRRQTESMKTFYIQTQGIQSKTSTSIPFINAFLDSFRVDVDTIANIPIEKREYHMRDMLTSLGQKLKNSKKDLIFNGAAANDLLESLINHLLDNVWIPLWARSPTKRTTGMLSDQFKLYLDNISTAFRSIRDTVPPEKTDIKETLSSLCNAIHTAFDKLSTNPMAPDQEWIPQLIALKAISETIDTEPTGNDNENFALFLATIKAKLYIDIEYDKLIISVWREERIRVILIRLGEGLKTLNEQADFYNFIGPNSNELMQYLIKNLLDS